jgi:hypothetical protein
MLIIRVAFLFMTCCALKNVQENRNLRTTENYYRFGSRTVFNDSIETGRLLAPTKSSFRKVPSKIFPPSISLESIPSNLFMQVLAGSSATGFSGDNSAATSATIDSSFPWVDSNGNIYIPDTNNKKIRKVVNGIITTFAGSVFSSAGASGTRTSVKFSKPFSIMGDSSGTALYLCDTKYIWQYTFSSDVFAVIAHSVTLAAGFSGDNGPATDAQLNAPQGIWLTTSNILYIADTTNNRIRMISSGIITTFAGTGTGGCAGDTTPAISAQLSNPKGVYMDTNGKLFIADSSCYRIRVVNPNGIIITLAGSGSPSTFNGDNLPGTSAKIGHPNDVKGDTLGNLYISDDDNCIIRIFDGSIISTLFGTPGTCAYASNNQRTATLSNPTGVWVDSLSTVYFSDSYSVRRGILAASPTSQPSGEPTRQPTRCPTTQPSSRPSSQPIIKPSSRPTGQPSLEPTQPTSQPTCRPSSQPFARPTSQPTRRPSSQPSSCPSAQPNSNPSSKPSGQPTTKPSAEPSNQPSSRPTSQPTKRPSNHPSSQPMSLPSGQPTSQPSIKPSRQPSSRPSNQPTSRPTMQPISQPTGQPTQQPTRQPSSSPSSQPSSKPSSQPSDRPSRQPTTHPSTQPSSRPTSQPFSGPTSQPSKQPNSSPTARPSTQPTVKPSNQPTMKPTTQPSGRPTRQPSSRPSSQPTSQPSGKPSTQPSQQPSSCPSNQPSSRPTTQPSSKPTKQPTAQPTRQPSCRPTTQPSSSPSSQPSSKPSSQPTNRPSRQPTTHPSTQPTSFPSSQPFSGPTSQPSGQPNAPPSSWPSNQPTEKPSCQPSTQPIMKPSTRPSSQPTRLPSVRPTTLPSSSPSDQPSSKPSSQPASLPSAQPSTRPSARPTSLLNSQASSRPTSQPSGQPTCVPTLQTTAFPTTQPTSVPSSQPSSLPSAIPTSQPSSSPSNVPSRRSTRVPSSQPTAGPSVQPSSHPSSLPSMKPSCEPSCNPSTPPSSLPIHGSMIPPPSSPSVSFHPSPLPSLSPTRGPTTPPSSQPSNEPTTQPTERPSSFPSMQPSSQPTNQPTVRPSTVPTTQPTRSPSAVPSHCPSSQPSQRPTFSPSCRPTSLPTLQPSTVPSTLPTNQPTSFPSCRPTTQPSSLPSSIPSSQPSQKNEPLSSRPLSEPPSVHPTNSPVSSSPTRVPTFIVTESPSSPLPSLAPSVHPTRQPTTSLPPTKTPTIRPSFPPESASAPTISVFPPNNIHFEGKLFSFGSYLPSVQTIPDIYLTEEAIGSSFIIFGFREEKERKKREITIGSRTSEGLYAPVGNEAGGGLMQDRAMSRTTLPVDDFNGDSHEDLLVCDPLNSVCFTYFGNGDGMQDLPISFALKSMKSDLFGWSAAKLNDLDGDGFADIAISALSSNVIYLFFGANSYLNDVIVDELDASTEIKIIGSQNDQNSGLALSSAGDFNGDGYSDLLFSAMQISPYQNVIYILFLSPIITTTDIIIDNLAANKDYLKIIAARFSFAGFSLSNLGDINQDGFADIIIGSIPYSGRYLTQKSYVIYGRNSSFNTLLLEEMSEDDGFIITGGGFMVAGPGDVNNDGIPDIMISSYQQWQGMGNSYLMVYPRNITSPPTLLPSSSPSSSPSNVPTTVPSLKLQSPTSVPTLQDTSQSPVSEGTFPPFLPATRLPSFAPKTTKPTRIPSVKPSTRSPTMKTDQPTRLPTRKPTLAPITKSPSQSPTKHFIRSAFPTSFPSFTPTLSLSTPFQELVIDTAGVYTLANGNWIVIISGEGSFEITISGGSRKTIYIIIPSKNTIRITDFNDKYDQISLLHFSQLFSINDLIYRTNPLQIFLSTEQKLILSSLEASDLAESNFIFQEVNEEDKKRKNVPQLSVASMVSLAGLLLFFGLVAFLMKVNEVDKDDNRIKASVEEINDLEKVEIHKVETDEAVIEKVSSDFGSLRSSSSESEGTDANDNDLQNAEGREFFEDNESSFFSSLKSLFSSNSDEDVNNDFVNNSTVIKEQVPEENICEFMEEGGKKKRQEKVIFNLSPVERHLLNNNQVCGRNDPKEDDAELSFVFTESDNDLEPTDATFDI